MEVDLRLRDPEKGGAADAQNQGLALRRGDVILLCSDGLSDLVADADILAAVKGQEPQQAAEQLVRMARANGGYDNITVVAIEMRTGAPAAGGGRLRRVGLLGVGVVALAGAVTAAAMFLGGDRGPEPTVAPTVTLEEPTATASLTSVSSPEPATAAPAGGPTALPSPTPMVTEPGAEETAGPATPTSVPTFTPTRTPTASNTPRATSTATPTGTPTATGTPPPPGAATPTPTQTPAPSNTPGPPTDTPTITNTPGPPTAAIPTATYTPIPEPSPTDP